MQCTLHPLAPGFLGVKEGTLPTVLEMMDEVGIGVKVVQRGLESVKMTACSFHTVRWGHKEARASEFTEDHACWNSLGSFGGKGASLAIFYIYASTSSRGRSVRKW